MSPRAPIRVFKGIFSLNIQRTLSSEAYVVKSKVEPIDIPKTPLTNFIWDHSVKHHGDKIAMVSSVYKSI